MINTGAAVVDVSEFGTGPIFLAELNCKGSEEAILECIEEAAPIRAHSCDHIHDVGVHCQGE